MLVHTGTGDDERGVAVAAVQGEEAGVREGAGHGLGGPVPDEPPRGTEE
ncbi:hypothetical protein [Streptomyces atroolivaceus]